MTRLLIDGVAFQQGGPTAALWRDLLPRLAGRRDLTLLLLDRGGLPVAGGAQAIPFPAFRGQAAADSALIHQLCEQFRVDVFTTTGSTSPLATPMVLLVTDAAASEADPEAEAAATFAQHYVCTSAAAREALLRRYPEVPAAQIALAADGSATAVADALAHAAVATAEQARTGRYRAFFTEWQRLRTVQAAVDCV